MTNVPQKKRGERWSALVNDGKEVKLFSQGGGSWTVCECASEAEAAHIVAELKAWAKHLEQIETYNRLCRAGD